MHAWERALAGHELEALLACYARRRRWKAWWLPTSGAGSGICRGHEELRPFLAEVMARTPETRQYHREGFFTDGRRATWEYPRVTPDGEQMDFVEIMDIEDGLIQAYRVYWGWRGVDVLINDQYHRE